MSDTLEDEYFARIEAEKKARLASQLDDEDAEANAAELKALHAMHCGKCGQKMISTHFKGVEIEVCPSCGAVLLDPGELEQLAGDEQHGAVLHIARLFGFAKK
jgi:rubrerythrin